MNSWFINNAIPILDSMIEHGIGCPIGFCGDYDPELNDHKPRKDGKDPFEVWKEILIEMRAGFKHYVDVCENMVGYDEVMKKYNAPRSWDKWLNEVKWSDEDKANHDAAYKDWWALEKDAVEHRDRSLKLFVKYFDNLWD